MEGNDEVLCALLYNHRLTSFSYTPRDDYQPHTEIFIYLINGLYVTYFCAHCTKHFLLYCFLYSRSTRNSEEKCFFHLFCCCFFFAVSWRTEQRNYFRIMQLPTTPFLVLLCQTDRHFFALRSSYFLEISFIFTQYKSNYVPTVLLFNN